MNVHRMLRLLAIMTVLLLGMTACSGGTDGDEDTADQDPTVSDDAAEDPATTEAEPDDAAADAEGSDEPISIGVL
ncbi:MAG TPA: hypothetical protein VMM13_06570, partial [Euzebya sp.]|nr:hypothetical protein [Euzebya sp.]